MRQSSLPIESLRSEFERALGRGPVVLSSPTGSGKSTQVPRWCAAAGGRVLVVEPRRVACRSLAQRVAQLEGTALGDGVGYQVRDERRAGGVTRILFATPGIVLRLFDSIHRFDTVIVDEFHERGLEVDLLLALLLDSRRQGGFGGRLVVMSATLDGERIARHLGGEHLHAEGRTFPVEIHHVAGKALLPDVRGLEERLGTAVEKCRDLEGDLLVFLPGKGEIASCQRALAHRRDLLALPLHGGLTLSQQSRVFEPTALRRVILATNVAETSLTVPGIGVVIDSGLVRQTRYHRDRGFLTLTPVARDSADQRAGRAGRTAAGTVFRLWSEAAQLEDRTAPEIYRESLVPLLLSAAACSGDPAELPFLDPPTSHALDAAGAELEALGALDRRGGLTARGRRLFGLPLDPLLGRLLVEAEERRDPELMADMVDLVSALSVDRPLTAPRRDDEGELSEATLEERCDALALLWAVRGPGGRQDAALSEAHSVRRRLRDAFEVQGESGAAVDRQRLARAVMAADRRVVHVARRRGRRLFWSNGGTEIEVSRKSHLRDAEGVEAVAVLGTMALGLGGRDVRIVATQVMPLPVPWVVEAGLGRDRLAGVQVASGRVVARMERTYAGKVLAQREDVPEGELARQAVAELFHRGSLFQAVREKSRANLEAVALAQRLAASTADPPYWLAELAQRYPEDVPDFEAWILDRLERLGVESGEDVALLDAEDLLFPPLPDHLQAELDRVWPRAWTVDGVRYRVDYDLPRGEAVLRPEKGKAKKLPERFFLPRFPGLTVRVEHKGTLHTVG